MFNKKSRYLRVADMTATDAKGRRLQAKKIRPQPDAGDTFPYTLTETDRLDHLGYRAFQKPEQWWRICDANPEYLHPQDLIGRSWKKECLIRLPIADDSTLPNWNAFLRTIRGLDGVEEALVEETVEIRTNGKVSDQKEQEYPVEEHFGAALRIIFNGIYQDEITLLQQIGTILGEELGRKHWETVSRTGKEISIPSGSAKAV